MKKQYKQGSAKYPKVTSKRILHDVCVSYAHYKNKALLKKIHDSSDRKVILNALLKMYKLLDVFKSGKIAIKYHKKKHSSGNTLADIFHTRKGNFQCTINIYDVQGNNLREKEKKLFIIQVAHELSHARYEIDNYTYNNHELAVDMLVHVMGFTHNFMSIYEEGVIYPGYIDENDFWILDMIQKKSQVIYLPEKVTSRWLSFFYQSKKSNSSNSPP